MTERVVTAMSGGVDSSVAAALLKKEGYEVIGVTMRVYDYSGAASGEFGSCCGPKDVADARCVAEKLGIPFYLLDFEDLFRREVIDYFVSDYASGRTPNPCIACNKAVKFDELFKRAKALGADRVATGHYASVVSAEDTGRYVIKRGVDGGKDQSYFLFNLSQEQLSKIIMPLGRYTKKEVRLLARSLGLKVAEKAESQEICFIPDNNLNRFLGERLRPGGIKSGNFVDGSGKILGKHSGIPFYTIGQRRRLGLAIGRPLYVTSIDPESGEIRVGSSDKLMRKTFAVKGVNWSLWDRVDGEIEAHVQIRHKHRPAKAKIKPLGSADKVLVELYEPQRAITPGQAAVFYIGDLVAGGGWIAASSGN